MKFSFILPAFKGRYLQAAISSILAQDYDNFELIVVDDHSPDNLQHIVSNFHDSRISYHRNEKNIGGTDLVSQWNHCLSYAAGQYVILATDDDLYEPYFLSTFVPLIAKYPDVNIFRARVLQINDENEIRHIDRCYKEFLSAIEFRYHMLHGMSGGIPQYIFKRNPLIEKGGFISFPKAWASDDATALMMSNHGVVTSQKHLVRFRWSDINISSDKHCGVEKFQARLLFSRWLNDHQTELCGEDSWNKFYKRTVIDYLPIFNKISLIETMKTMTLKDWIICLNKLMQSDLFTFKNKCSIILRSLQSRF